mmetsp:Transcript_50892/g.146179  ORF Transcript_50892/g.146179 Transcript_50892/m.146179 type:complete len:360 (+) Transcript_50892:1260-2339(+)
MPGRQRPAKLRRQQRLRVDRIHLREAEKIQEDQVTAAGLQALKLFDKLLQAHAGGIRMLLREPGVADHEEVGGATEMPPQLLPSNDVGRPEGLQANRMRGRQVLETRESTLCLLKLAQVPHSEQADIAGDKQIDQPVPMDVPTRLPSLRREVHRNGLLLLLLQGCSCPGPRRRLQRGRGRLHQRRRGRLGRRPGPAVGGGGRQRGTGPGPGATPSRPRHEVAARGAAPGARGARRARRRGGGAAAGGRGRPSDPWCNLLVQTHAGVTAPVGKNRHACLIKPRCRRLRRARGHLTEERRRSLSRRGCGRGPLPNGPLRILRLRSVQRGQGSAPVHGLDCLLERSLSGPAWQRHHDANERL